MVSALADLKAKQLNLSGFSHLQAINFIFKVNCKDDHTQSSPAHQIGRPAVVVWCFKASGAFLPVLIEL